MTPQLDLPHSIQHLFGDFVTAAGVLQHINVRQGGVFYWKRFEFACLGAGSLCVVSGLYLSWDSIARSAGHCWK